MTNFRGCQFSSKGGCLKQSEEFEDNYDNDNHADDVEDTSVHIIDSYQHECAVASVFETGRKPVFATRGGLVLEGNVRSALIAPPVVQAAFWTHVSRAALVLPTLQFASVEVASVLSYCSHIVRFASASRLRRRRVGTAVGFTVL